MYFCRQFHWYKATGLFMTWSKFYLSRTRHTKSICSTGASSAVRGQYLRPSVRAWPGHGVHHGPGLARGHLYLVVKRSEEKKATRRSRRWCRNRGRRCSSVGYRRREIRMNRWTESRRMNKMYKKTGARKKRCNNSIKTGEILGAWVNFLTRYSSKEHPR